MTDDLFVTDTYPDSRRMAKIYMVDANEHKVTPIVKVYSRRDSKQRISSVILLAIYIHVFQHLDIISALILQGQVKGEYIL